MFSFNKQLFSLGRSNIARRYCHAQNRLSGMFPIPFDTPSVPDPSGERTCRSHVMMRNKNLLMGQYAGTFYLPPFTLRALEKLNALIDHEMKSIGAQKIALPSLNHIDLWKKSNRVNEMGKELFRLSGNGGLNYCLAPTHEECVTDLVAAVSPLSRHAFPLKLYQIGRKYRDEARPKHGLLRCKEFEMKDLYTFDTSEDNARFTYDEVCQAYVRLFKALQVPFVKVEASSGAMGGSKSDEFHLLSDIGEDILLKCSKCQQYFNTELEDKLDSSYCQHEFHEIRGIEVGHAFLLGTRYSEALGAHYRGAEDDGGQASGKPRPLTMACFGIGTTRLLQACIEVLSSDTDIRWPKLIAPYQIAIIPQKAGYREEVTNALASSLYSTLHGEREWYDEVLVDDRTRYSIGVRIKWARQIGIPYLVVLGKNALLDTPLYELIDTYQHQKFENLTKEELIKQLKNMEEEVEVEMIE